MNQLNYYAVSALFNGIIAIFLVYYVYLRNRRTPLNRSFLYFGISVGGWSLMYSAWVWSENAQTAETYARFLLAFASVIPATFFHFVAQFTKRDTKLRKAIFFFYLIGFLYVIASFTPMMITGVQKVMFFNYWGVAGPLFKSQFVYFSSVVGLAFYCIIIRCIKVHGQERRQTLWMLGAFAIGFGGGATNYFIWFDILIPPATNFFVGVTFAMIAYAIVRYGLMDVDSMVEILRSSRTATLGLLASSLNHELRNPLYVAKGRIDTFLEAVERGAYAEPAVEIAKSREILQAAAAQLNRAMDIVQRFSGFARPYKMDEPKQDMVLAEVVEDVLSFAGQEFELHKIRLTEKPSNGLSIYANRRQMEEILFNLIVNAFQAMRDQGGEMSIRASQPNGKVIIEVADTGPGIPEENQKRIFDPFFSTKGKDGTGLGLYITKQLVERNGGKISVKSKIGRGTSFVLEFRR